MIVLACLALVVAILQKTSLAFLSPDAADFVWGLTAGLWIGALVTVFLTRSGE